MYNVNIDLRHQYGISIAVSQTFLFVKRPQMGRSEEKRLFSQANTLRPFDLDAKY